MKQINSDELSKNIKLEWKIFSKPDSLDTGLSLENSELDHYLRLYPFDECLKKADRFFEEHFIFSYIEVDYGLWYLGIYMVIVIRDINDFQTHKENEKSYLLQNLGHLFDRVNPSDFINKLGTVRSELCLSFICYLLENSASEHPGLWELPFCQKKQLLEFKRKLEFTLTERMGSGW